jgi:Zn finger protein HypA/HybF involved in hydrogenase expression
MKPLPRWVHVQSNACRCSDCGNLVQTTWRLYEKPSTWTRALCTACVSRQLELVADGVR